MDDPPVRDLGIELPAWYREFQKQSWEKFCDLPLPSRNDEAWRYADLKKSRFERLYPVESDTVPSSIKEKTAAVRFPQAKTRWVYWNGNLIEKEIGDFPEGVICLPVEEAVSCESDRLRSYFDLDRERLGDEKFAALHGAASKYGLFLWVPPGVELDSPIEVIHFVSGESAPSFPHTLVIAEDNAKASVIEQFHSLNSSESSLSIGVCDLHVDRGGAVEHVTVQKLNHRAKHVRLASANSGRDASIDSLVLNLGGAWVREESINRMTAPGADTRVMGANLANGIQEFDQRTLQIHDAENTTSDLLIKNALYDQSRVIFGGLIQVLPGAHHTDSYQSCRSLLGSDEVEINAMPGLEIDADQVRCSHGATSGQISGEELFYLRSRGIPAEEAQRIISCGFLHEAFEKGRNQEIVSWLDQMIDEEFAGL